MILSKPNNQLIVDYHMTGNIYIPQVRKGQKSRTTRSKTIIETKEKTTHHERNDRHNRFKAIFH